jgi:hypothetical protein
MHSCGSSECSTCRFFYNCQDRADIAKYGVQIKEIKGAGSANKVYAIEVGEMPGLSLVARFSLPKSGSYDWYDFDSLEESIWTKYELKVEWKAQNKADAEIEYVDKILTPLLGSKYVPPQVRCFRMEIEDNYLPMQVCIWF